MPYRDMTTCAPPGQSYAMTEHGNLAWTIIHGGLAGGAVGFIGYWMMKALADSIMWGCLAGIAVYVLALSSIYDLKKWYYNFRLMCIEEDQCAIGTLVDAPVISGGAFGDGDMKFDLLVAPFAADEVRDYFRERILDPAGPFGPGPPDPSDDEFLANYVAGFPEEKQNRLYITVVNADMLSPANRAAGRDFQDHYLVRDVAAMGQNSFDHSPPDTLADPAPNPMFRAEPHETLLPYMHCELEGDRFARTMDNIMAALWVGLLALIAACVLCEALALPPWACGLLAGLVAQLLAFLAWLIANWLNDPSDGDAGQQDVDISDPAYEGDSATIFPGDSLAIHGDWIMDEEHDKYFELHPVKAIYLVCRSKGGKDPPWEVIHDLTDRRKDCPYPMTAVTAEDAKRICGQIAPMEKDKIEKTIVRTHSRALSVAAGIR
jgi:hypothetical protein